MKTNRRNPHIAVGTPIAGSPPHRSRRARFTHRAPTLGIWRQNERLAKDVGREAMVTMHRRCVRSDPIGCDPSGCGIEVSAAIGSPRGTERCGLVDRRRKAKQRIRGFLLQHSLTEPENISGWGQDAIAGLQALPLSKNFRFSLDLLIEDLLHVLDQMQQVNRRLKELASEKRFAESAKHLRTHPGVGDVTCMQVLTELYQPKRFENSKQVAAYVGLAPQVRQSGGTRTEGPLLRGGRGALRSTLVEAAWAWVKVDKRAGKIYGRMVKNTGNGKKAIVAMARRMLINLWIMLVRKEDYRPQAA